MIDKRELSDWERRQFVVALLTALTLIGLWTGFAQTHRNSWAVYCAAFLLGAGVAVAELVSRYTDAPTAAIVSLPAFVYVGVNAGASLAALFLIRVFRQDFGQSGSAGTITQVLAAGLASAAFFRSSLFTVPAGGQILGIGPSAVLDVIMRAADRAVDRRRAVIRARQASVLVRDLNLDQCAVELVGLALGAMQNLTESERQTVQEWVDDLRRESDGEVSERAAARKLALRLLTLVGSRVLAEAVERVRPHHESTTDEAMDDVVDLREDLARASTVVRILEGNPGELALEDLQAEVGIPLREFSELMESLVQAGVLRITGSPGVERVSLSE